MTDEQHSRKISWKRVKGTNEEKATLFKLNLIKAVFTKLEKGKA